MKKNRPSTLGNEHDYQNADRSPTRMPAGELKDLRDRNKSRDWLLAWASGFPRRLRGCQFRNLKHYALALPFIRQARKWALGLYENRAPYRFPTRLDWQGPNLILTGDVGAGKTSIAIGSLFHLIELLATETEGNHVTRNKFKADFLTLSDLSSQIRATYSYKQVERRDLPFPSLFAYAISECYVSTEAEFIQHLINLDLLIIDDIVTEEPTDFTARILLDIVNGRSARGNPTIVTSNYALGDAVEADLLDLRVVSRLCEDAVQINIKGPDLRMASPDVKKVLQEPRLELSYEVDPEPHRDLKQEEREAEEAATRDDLEEEVAMLMAVDEEDREQADFQRDLDKAEPWLRLALIEERLDAQMRLAEEAHDEDDDDYDEPPNPRRHSGS